jgi:hypothetical protein
MNQFSLSPCKADTAHRFFKAIAARRLAAPCVTSMKGKKGSA